LRTDQLPIRSDGHRADWLPQPRPRPVSQQVVPPQAVPPRVVTPRVVPPTTAGPVAPAEPVAPSDPVIAASPRVASAAWWQPGLLAFAILLAVAMLLMPFAVTPRVVAGTPFPKQVSRPRPAVVPAPAEPAALPDGVPVTPSGAGTWHVVPGATGTAAGTAARQLTYTVEVEDGLDAPSFAADVDAILADPRGWTGLGDVSFRRVDGTDAEPDVRIGLTSPGTSRRPDLCGFAIPYDSSCYLRKRHRVVVNLARWLRGAHSFDGDLAGYHRYAINHEVGHALGHPHVGCPAPGAPAPVMMQQTFGLSNTYLAQLNQADPGAAVRVHPDGAVCRPNSWVTPAP
jgi:hypothetical protein